MKPVAVLFYLFLILIAYNSCTDPIYYEGPKSSFVKQKNLSIEVSEDNVEIPLKVKEGFEFNLLRITESNLTGQLLVSITGIIKKIEANGTYEFDDGEIFLLSKIKGCNLYGTFNGNGVKYGNEFEISAIIEVEYGTGIFGADEGELFMKIKGRQLDDNANIISYKCDIIGELRKRIFLQH